MNNLELLTSHHHRQWWEKLGVKRQSQEAGVGQPQIPPAGRRGRNNKEARAGGTGKGGKPWDTERSKTPTPEYSAQCTTHSVAGTWPSK